jgi:hypothetical protein
MYFFIFISCLNTITSMMNTYPFFDFTDFQELLGERMHQQLLARGTPLLTTMSKYVAVLVVVGGGWWWLVVGGGVFPYS